MMATGFLSIELSITLSAALASNFAFMALRYAAEIIERNFPAVVLLPALINGRSSSVISSERTSLARLDAQEEGAK
jgi:hypothetical protein